MAMENTFRVGDPVWGKIKGFSAWPGKVILPPDGLKVILKSRDGEQWQNPINGNPALLSELIINSLFLFYTAPSYEKNDALC